jgi:uncharacterized membrane protein YgcG
MKRLLALGAGTLAALVLFPLLLAASPASASTLSDCLARQHVCVTGEGRSLVSAGQQSELERQIGGDGIYLVVAPSGSAGYRSSMNQIISTLSEHPEFTVGFLDSRLRHFGAYNQGMLPSGGAADIATHVVEQHRADQNVVAALTDFVTDVQDQAGSGADGAGASTPSHTLRNVAIGVSVLLALGVLGFFLIARPVRQRRQRELKEAKLAAQDDLIALSTGVTDHDADVAIRDNPEAAQEQAAALGAYERGTAALDAARRPSCFFDPRHGMSVTDAYWTPPDGGPGRTVPVCSADAHKLERGIEPEMRKVEADGGPVNYVNAGFAPAYWGGFGLGPGLFTGFLLGQALAPHAFFGGYPGDGDSGGDSGGGDFGGGDFGGFGGGDFGGGDF